MSDALYLPLNEVQAGAVLAAPVLDAGGAVLLPAGLTLTDSHLDSLRNREIPGLTIALPAAAPAPEDIAREQERIRQRVLHVFRHTADDPGAQALLHAVLAFRLENPK